MDAGIDYRLRTLTQANLYLTPLNSQTEQAMAAIFVKLAGKEGGKGNGVGGESPAFACDLCG